MTHSSNQTNRWFGFIPRGGRSLVTFVALIAAAFVFGWMISGPDDAPTNGASGEAAHDHASEQPTVWTCSMHPQVQLPKEGKCPICFMDLIPLESGDSGSVDPNQLRMSPNAALLARIRTTPVRRAFAESEVRMYGRLAYDETRLSYITAWVAGRVDKLHVDYSGAEVKKGEPLVSLYSPALFSAQEELIQAARVVAKESTGKLTRSTAEATLSAAREKLRLYGLSAGQIDEIESSDVAEDHSTIYSPGSGIVIHKAALEGMYVKPGTQLFTIVDLSKLWVIFDAYETDLAWLAVGQSVSFTSRAFPGEQFEAVVTFVDPILDTKTRTARIRAEVDNSRGRLKPDMFTQGVVHSMLDINGNVTSGRQDASKDAPLMIPATAPLVTGKRAIVYVELPQDDDRLFEGRIVELGPRAGDYYIVSGGLSEGERVVTNGAFKIDAELQIRAKPSMMSPEGGAPPPGHDHAGHESQTVAIAEEAEMESLHLSQEAVASLTPTYDAYFRFQAALAADDLEVATSAADRIAVEIKAVDMKLFDGDAHTLWMELSNHIATHAVVAAAGMDIESVRASFEKVSYGMIDLHKGFDHVGDRTFYLAFCPMAFDNKGAHWLQTDSTINNPYFGDMMLRCGEIQDRMVSKEAGN